MAKAIRAGQPGASEPFKYFDKGALAVVGRGKAVCEVRGRRISGLPAFVMYIAVHLFYMGGVGGRRLTAGLTALGSLFGARESRVMHGEASTRRAPGGRPGPGAPAPAPATTSAGK